MTSPPPASSPPHSHPRSGRRSGRILLRAVIFLGVFALVLITVAWLYLFPALQAAKGAGPAERKQLAAHATLVLAVVLFVLFAGLVLTFRVGRYFFPRPPVARPKPTQYVDAWAEAGRRMKAGGEDDDSEPEEDR